MSQSTRAVPKPTGDRCAFPRNLTRGAYGGDVNCLQQYLRHTGYLVDEEPSGYFNSATEEALKRWQQANGITRSPGLFGVPGRALYAKARGPPDTCLSHHLICGRVFPDTTEAEDNKTCIDVCAEFAGQQDCQTRCVRAAADKKYACREACQVAFSTACDRAFPPTMEGGSSNYQVCLAFLDGSCEDTCAAFK